MKYITKTYTSSATLAVERHLRKHVEKEYTNTIVLESGIDIIVNDLRKAISDYLAIELTAIPINVSVRKGPFGEIEIQAGAVRLVLFPVRKEIGF